jgi:acetate kinase
MIILVLNCGSSSIKYQLFNMNNGDVLAKGLVERIGIKDSILTHKPTGKEQYKIVTDIADHSDGINMVIAALCDSAHGVIKNVNEIWAVGHRVLIGGENHKKSIWIDESVKKDIKDCFEIGPLHNPANLKGILSVEKLISGVPQVAVFDTSFHQTMPDYAFMYALPYEYYEKYRTRKYGFHGTSHKFVSSKAASLLGKDVKDLKIISCHLGNGASITAIKDGMSIDTSMGFTPVDGLIMGTRTGEVDPSVINYIVNKEKLDVEGVNTLINKRSGVLGISQLSPDMRDIEAAAKDGNEKAILALKMYAYRAKKFIGSYFAALNGLDLLIFTGGVGENDFNMRKMICTDMESLGIVIDDNMNDGVRGKDKILSKSGSKVTIMSINTDEEFVIASDTRYIVEHHIN